MLFELLMRLLRQAGIGAWISIGTVGLGHLIWGREAPSEFLVGPVVVWWSVALLLALVEAVVDSVRAMMRIRRAVRNARQLLDDCVAGDRLSRFDRALVLARWWAADLPQVVVGQLRAPQLLFEGGPAIRKRVPRRKLIQALRRRGVSYTDGLVITKIETTERYRHREGYWSRDHSLDCDLWVEPYECVDIHATVTAFRRPIDTSWQPLEEPIMYRSSRAATDADRRPRLEFD